MLVFILAVLIITILLDLFIRKKHNIVYEFSLYRPVNNAHKWFEWIFLFLFIVVIIVSVFILFYTTEIYAMLFGFLMILTAFRSIMEYKYEKEEKNYVINFLWTIGHLVIFIGVISYTL
ncbi:DUF4181 domain-containing protein [Ornithinibacillus californiensis]|uniref:DUF4181 domain-containing protein n=1 Tax=Ornithinibacillus californiensis TaxID=161536 RepID=UPI00064DB863|nr:DUF4181 domain-containing protein [Ornithinibacillus californiensis]